MINWLKKNFYPVMFVMLTATTIFSFVVTVNGTSSPVLHHIAILLNGATWVMLIAGWTLRRINRMRTK